MDVLTYSFLNLKSFAVNQNVYVYPWFYPEMVNIYFVLFGINIYLSQKF